MDRREFIGKVAGAACFGWSDFGADEKPLFTAGFVTDTHIRAEPLWHFGFLY